MLKNIFNIKPKNKFLPTLANWVLNQYGSGFELDNLTILLPSRRAARELKKEFLNLSKNEALILPKILAIGDVDYDEFLIDDFGADLKLSNIDYQIELINAIKDWNFKTNLFGKNISTSALANIADSLKSFLDEAEKEGINLEKLKEIDDSELASHKQQILKFLQHFSFVWKNAMLKKGIISHAQKQNLIIQNYNEFLQKNGSPRPIIAAGSTGSVGATRDLLKTISKLPSGKIILFGLDKKLDEKIWNKVDEIHPQFSLKKLLDNLEIKRSEISEIGDGANDSIEDLCELTMLPAEFSDKWIQEKLNQIDSEIRNYKKIECKNEFEEAKIISLLMRETLETKGKTAALISNDKNLINLVKDNLAKWKIKIDDSQSSNLAESQISNYLFLISEFSLSDFNSARLLAVLKHPLSNVDQNLLEILELEFLRKTAKFSSFDDLILKTKNHPELQKFLIEISEIFKVLLIEFKKEKINFKNVVKLHFECFAALRKTEDLTDIFNEFTIEINLTQNDFELEPQSYNHLLKKFLTNYQFRKNESFHPRLHILSTMEARLMNHDLTIVSGLIEGEFPSKSSDNFLGNKLRSDLGLSAQSKKIGTMAYDFCNYIQGGNVVLLYPKNQNNSPTIKSRFLLKLETILKINNLENLFESGSEYLNLNVEQQYEKTEEPSIAPAIKLEKFSATDISKWIRNPYYIYAKRILKLKPLKTIEASASFAEFGNFVHKALEEFIKNYPNINLIDYGKKIFPDYFPDPTSHLLWWSKFENLSLWFLKEEKKLRENLKESFVEVEVEMIINDVLLTTKIDRVNLYNDETFEIVDYKTGTLPETKEIKSGLEPQLAVEAIILKFGQIKNYPDLQEKISTKNIKNLQYQNLKGKDQNKIKNLDNVDELTSAANVGIIRLLEIFNEEKIGYVCAPNLDIYEEDDYWHLGRIDK